MKIVGLDLAGKEKNPTGFCLLKINEREETEIKLLHTDVEIMEEIRKIKPDIICVDAPLSFPPDGYFRDSDIEMKRRGFKPLPPMFPAMRLLVKRGIKVNYLPLKVGLPASMIRLAGISRRGLISAGSKDSPCPDNPLSRILREAINTYRLSSPA